MLSNYAKDRCLITTIYGWPIHLLWLFRPWPWIYRDHYTWVGASVCRLKHRIYPSSDLLFLPHTLISIFPLLLPPIFDQFPFYEIHILWLVYLMIYSGGGNRIWGCFDVLIICFESNQGCLDLPSTSHKQYTSPSGQ